jgi:ketosteroid isomerase-like protein
VKSNPSREARAVRRVIVAAMKNWSRLDADANQAFYTSSAQAVFFDFTPMQYVGWASYASEIKKVQESIRKFKITLRDDLKVSVRGRMAYAHGTWKMDFLFTDGAQKKLQGRLTEVLEKQKGKWIIVHEHASIPTPH